MEFTKVIKERYSVRKYKPDMIWNDELNRVVKSKKVYDRKKLQKPSANDGE